MSTETSYVLRCALAAVIVALVLAAAAWGQTDEATPVAPVVAPAAEPAPAAAPQPPFIGKMWAETASRVYIRSGPGTAYYPVAIVNVGTEVTVTADDGTWKQILPPAECFSLIAKKYVELADAEAKTGTVTGENVNVRAGPYHSELVKDPYARQGAVAAGTPVTVLGAWTGTLDGEQMEFYKIAPPKDARAYVASQFCKYDRPLASAVRPTPAGSGGETVILPPDTTAQQFANLEKALDEACKKPSVDKIDPDELARLAGHYQKVADATRDEHVKASALYRVQWINQRIALIAALAKARSAAEAIDQRISGVGTPAAPVQPTGATAPTGQTTPAEKKFTEVGRIEVGVFTEIEPNRFRLVGTGPGGIEQTLCYVEAVPGGPDLKSLLGKRVGVVGTKNFVTSWQQHLIYVREVEVLDAPAAEAPPATPPATPAPAPTDGQTAAP